MTIRIAYQARPQHATFARMRDGWLRAEDAGADAIFNWDHFYPLYGDRDGLHFECWTLLAAMAEVTTRVEIGALVACNSYRNPELVADMARTIDHIAGGRFILGLGAGWFERDYTEYGYEFGTVGDRLRALGAALPRIEARLAKLNPPPVRDIPVMIGGRGEKVTLKLVARHAQIWHGFGAPEEYGRLCGILDDHCATVGRDPAAIVRSCSVNTTEELANLQGYLDAGATLIVTGGTGPDYDVSVLRALVAERDARNAG
jgi:probable F420-dependent oxidoreductase